VALRNKVAELERFIGQQAVEAILLEFNSYDYRRVTKAWS
jgi:hypothetical protein